MNTSSDAQNSVVDKLPEQIESFKCSKCGSIEMLDVTGIDKKDIQELKECAYICKRCLSNLYPEFYDQEHIEP